MLVKIIGIGPGSPDYMLPKAAYELGECDLIVGFKRAVNSIGYIPVPKKVVESLQKLLEEIEGNPDQTVGIVASGDPCFYGILDYIKKNIKETNFEVIPGISSFQYLMTKLQKSWQEAYVGSLHGREADFEKTVKEYPLSVWLTDKVQNPNYICEKLLATKEDYWVYIGENLSYADEKITKGTSEELQNQTWSDLSVVVVERKA